MEKLFAKNIDTQSDFAGEGVTRKVLSYTGELMICEVMFKKGAVIDSKNFEHNCKYFQINKDYWVYILYNMQCVGNVSTPDSV